MIEYAMYISKEILKTVLLIFAFLLFPLSVFSFTYYSADSLSFDTKLSEEETEIYSTPAQIYITQVTTNANELSRNPERWVKTLYYYSITRHHLLDIPYTYLLDENGIIYQGTSGGIGVNPQLREVDGAVMIGYLSNSPMLTSRASESLEEMVEKISFDWGISELSVVKLYLNQEEGKISTITAEETTGDFANSVSQVLEGWEGYETVNLEYRVRIEDIEYNEEIEIGERLSVRLKIRNVNDFVWFTDRDPIYVSVKDSEESDFAINQEWDSFSKPVSISDKNILPGESVEFEFNLEARVFLGEVTESFEILKFEDQPFENSSFDLDFNIVQGDKQLVEIASPRYSFANIRDCRWFSCDILDSADNGEIFIFIEEEAGWSRIKFGPDQYGWVSSAYLNRL